MITALDFAKLPERQKMLRWIVLKIVFVLTWLLFATAHADVDRFTDGDAARGAPLYTRYCRGCHGADGRGGAHTFMPHIENLTKKEYIEFLPDSYLLKVITEGGPSVGKSSYMPAFGVKLSEQDVKDIIAHVRSLPRY